MATSRIVDADGHIMEPPNLWTDNLESRFKKRAMRLRADNEGLEYLEIDGKMSKVLNGGQLGSLGLLDEEMAPRRAEAFEPGLLDFADCTPPAAVDPHARIKWMDEQGIDTTILYPSLGLNWQSECEDAALAAAHCRVLQRLDRGFLRILSAAFDSRRQHLTQGCQRRGEGDKAGGEARYRRGLFVSQSHQRNSLRRSVLRSFLGRGRGPGSSDWDPRQQHPGLHRSSYDP